MTNRKSLTEDSRADLIRRGKAGDNYKDQSKGRNRYERRTHSRVSSSVKNYNKIDMNKLFKDNILDVGVEVNGETDTYIVRLLWSGFLSSLKMYMKDQDEDTLDFRSISRALTDSFNHNDVFIHCSCLHPDTIIPLLDGSYPSVSEMLDRYERGEQLYVYSVDENGDFKPGVVEKVWITKTASSFIKVTLDNNKYIITTPDHLYMLRDGSYKQAEDLQIGQSLMPLYFNVWQNGYDGVKLNSTGKYHSVYKLVADYFKSDEINEALKRVSESDNMRYDVAIHHKDFNKHNNNPENLIPMTAREHWEFHANNCTFISEQARKKLSDRMKELNANPTSAMIANRKSWAEKGKLRNYDEDRKKQQSEIFKKTRSNETEEDKLYRLQRIKESYVKNNSAQKISARKKEFWAAKTHEEKSAIKLTADRKRIKSYIDNILADGLVPTPELADIYRIKHAPKWSSCFDSWEELISYYELNHKVINIEHITLSDIPVYDIKIKDYSNFLTDAGVILHNCPDWRYRMDYWAHTNDISSVEKTDDPLDRPSDITNPDDTKGPGCKHTLLILNNLSWLVKVASVIMNYIKYMKQHYPRLYADIIYPAIFEREFEEPVQLDILDKVAGDDEDTLVDDEEEIDTANQWAKTKSQFKVGNDYRFKPQEKEIEGQKQFDFDSEISD